MLPRTHTIRSRANLPLPPSSPRSYKVPRLAFINKLDRQGANPSRVIKDLRTKLKLNAVAVQVPIGLEDALSGVVDVITRKAYRFDGPKGETIVEIPVPDDLKASVDSTRAELIERLAEVDEEVGDLFLQEKEPSVDQIKAAIRRQVRSRRGTMRGKSLA